MRAYTVHSGCFVLNLGVDLTGRDIGGVAGADLGERLVTAAEGREHMHRGEHAGVCVEEVLEIVVRGVLTAENTGFFSHDCLDEGVTHTGFHGASTELFDELGYGLGGDEVIDNNRLLIAFRLSTCDFTLCHERGNGRGGDRVTLLINHEATVGIAVKGKTDVCAVLNNRFLQIDKVGGFKRVSRVVRESSVELKVKGHNLKRKRRQKSIPQDGGCGLTAHAVTRIHNNLEGTDIGEVYELTQVLGVGFENVLFGDDAGILNGRNGAFVEVLLGKITNIEKTGFGGYRHRPGLSHFHAIVFGGVVACGESNACRILNTACKVEYVG